MKIAIDGQTLVSPDANRGIGNYVRSLTQAFSRIKGHEFYLLNWGVPMHGVESSGSLRCVRLSASPLEPLPGLDTRYHRRNAAIRQFIRREGVDLLFNPNPMQLSVEAVSRVYPVPLVSTLHDLTPFQLPDLFLKGERNLAFEERYSTRFLHMKRHSTHIIADSDATRGDAVSHSAAAPENISVVRCGIAEVFRSGGRDCDPSELLTRTGVATKSGYLLSVGGYNLKKNFSMVFKALGRLAPGLLADRPLIMAGPIDDGEWAVLEGFRMEHCPNLRVYRTGYVTDRELAGLYRSAGALLFISLHEGFGLPVAEAFGCGCPVVTSNTSSLPEIAGGAALLCDPDSAESISVAIARLLESSQLRDELRSKGLTRAEEFSWDKAAVEASAVFEKVVSECSSTRSGKVTIPKLAWVSPLPPDNGGVAAYSASLLHEIGADYSVTLVTSHRADALPEDLRLFPRVKPDVYDLLSQRGEFLPVVHICNNVAQGATPFEWQWRSRRKHCDALAIVHDLNIHGFLLDYMVRNESPSAGCGREGYRALLGHAHGEAGIQEAGQVLESGQFPDIPRFPCHRYITQVSRAVVTHSLWGKARLENCSDAAPVFLMPLGIEHPLRADETSVARFRNERSADSGDMLIVCAGFLEPSRRIDVVIAALANLARLGVSAKLVLAGKAEPSHREWLGRVAEAHNVRGRVEFLDYLSRDDEFLTCLAAADVVVHLRHPTNGESSATILRALSLGRPVIVSNSDSYRELPDELCWKVDADKHEQALLTEYLKVLLTRPDVRQVIGVTAPDYIARHHAWPAIAGRFKAIVREVVSLPEQRIG